MTEVEAFARRAARGFRNVEYFKTVIYWLADKFKADNGGIAAAR